MCLVLESFLIRTSCALPLKPKSFRLSPVFMVVNLGRLVRAGVIHVFAGMMDRQRFVVLVTMRRFVMIGMMRRRILETMISLSQSEQEEQ